MSNLGRSLSALIIGSSQGMWRASLHTDGLNVYWFGLLLGLAMPDVLQTVGIKNWLLIVIVDTKNFGNWVDAAEDQHWWESHWGDFINFCRL